MILTPKHLPSQGKFIFNQPSVNILPLTFRQMVNYMSHPEANDVLRYRRDLLLLQDNGVDLNTLSLLDADFLIHFQKSLTINDSLHYITTVKCPHCGNDIQVEVNTNDFQFMDYEDNKVPSKIKLNNQEFDVWIPTIAEFLKCLDRYTQSNAEVDLDQLKLLSVFKDYEKSPRTIERDVLGCRGGDSAKLLWLDGLLFDRIKPIQVNCPNCSGGGEPVSISIKIDQIHSTFFRDFMWNNPIEENEVHFKQVRQDG